MGYSQVTTQNEYVSLGGIELSSNTKLQTYTGGIGLGGRYKPYEDVSFMGGVEFIYSRSGVNIQESDKGITTPVEDFLAILLMII